LLTGPSTGFPSMARGTFAVDSTAAQTFALSWQWTTPDGFSAFVMESAVLEQV
jgi:hypothetical protein